MSSRIPFRDANTGKKTPAAQPLQAVSTSEPLEWDGLYLERGFSDEFIAEGVYLPSLYIVMHTGQTLTFERKAGRSFRQQSMQAGQIWLNPPGMPFTHYVTRRCDYIALTVETDKLLTTLPAGQAFQHPHFERQYEVDDAQLRGILQTLAAEMEAGGPNGQLFVDSLATALGLHLGRCYDNGGAFRPNMAGGLDGRALQTIIDYMEAHLSESLSVGELARLVGLSKFHFTRLFKQTTRVSPYQFFLQRRLNRARQLLDRGGLTVGQVSHSLGFSDQSHFSKQFKNRFGITAGRYLKRRKY